MSFNALDEFIDERFYSILINKIKSEVKLALNDTINNETIQNVNHINNKNEMNLKENKRLEDLITTLKEEIKFLRNEMESKDKFNEHADKTEHFVGKRRTCY